MKQRLVIIILVIAAIFLIGPFLIPLPKQPELSSEEIDREGALEGGRFITIDDYQTFIKDVGPRDGKVVILIHGFGGSTFSWRKTMPALINNGYRAVALDLKGFGLANKIFEEDYSHPAQADFVARIMDSLEIEQATLIGHSMGGNVMAHFAMKFPDRVEKLVFVDAAIATGDESATDFRGGWLLKIPQIRRLARIAARSFLSQGEIREMLQSAVYHDELVTSDLVNGYYTPLTMKDWELAFFGIVRDSSDNVLPESLSELNSPALIIWGEYDTWVAPEAGDRLLEVLINAELVIVSESGHLPMEERPDDFNNLLLTFLEQGTILEGG
jgi:pimeloyl-ACP methyl ester carboxylesterase